MKLAISGSAGSGKTTIAKALAERFSIEFIAENYGPFFDQPGKFSQPPEQLAPSFWAVLSNKRQLEEAAGSFVADRCPIDLFHLWLVKRLFVLNDDTKKFFAKSKEYADDYDFVIFPPWGTIKLEPTGASSRKQRIVNPWIQQANHAAIVGYAYQWLPNQRIIQIPDTHTDIDERLDFICSEISRRKSD